MPNKPRIALLPFGRSTFDVAFAGQVLSRSLQNLAGLGAELIGSRELLFDAASARQILDEIKHQQPDLLLILQVTFTDATMTAAAAAELDAPIAIWATPEPRTGGRLRLNALCGLNLAAHALGKRNLPYDTIFARADDANVLEQLRAILANPSHAKDSAAQKTAVSMHSLAADILQKLRGLRLGRIGQHPDGFDTCEFDPGVLQSRFGVTVEQINLEQVFESARAVSPDRVSTLRHETVQKLQKLDEMDPDALDKSLRVYAALADLAQDNHYSALAVRCWPEMFTNYGCAACGAMARLNQEGIPAACEADVDGAITALILQELAGEPALLTDLVDVDVESDSAVLWHCGLAPLSMADPVTPPEAALHSNRQKPLLNQFAFKPGVVTLARFSKAKNQSKLVLGRAEMIRAPRPFSGTAGTLHFAQPVSEVLEQILREGLEHHYAFVYGNVCEGLRAVAAQLDIPVLELGAA